MSTRNTGLSLHYQPGTKFMNSALGQLTFGASFGIVLALCGNSLLDKPLYGIATVGLAVLVWMVLTHQKLALFIAVAGLVALEEFDLSSTEAFFAGGVETSLLGFRVLGISFMDLLLLLFLIPALLRTWLRWYETGRLPHFRTDIYFVPICAAFIMGALVGWFHKSSFSAFAWEAREIVYLVGWYFVVSRLLTRREDVGNIVLIMLGVFTVKSIVFLSRFGASQGLFYGYDFHRFALGSDIPMMALPMMMSIGALLMFKDAARHIRAGLAILVVYWSIMLAASLGRSTYVLSAAALVVVLMLLHRQMTWRSVLAGIGLVAVSGLGLFYLVLSPVQRELVGYLLGSAFDWVGAITISGDLSLGQRVMEIMNISETLTRAGGWIWGLGWGSVWTELVVIHPFDKGSFPIQEQMLGVHTSAHLDPVYYLLKVGILGTILIYFGHFRFVASAVKLFRREADRTRALCLLGIIALLIVTIPNYVYFVKIKCLMGIMYGCIGYQTMIDAGNATVVR
jgi:hypothetical protein